VKTLCADASVDFVDVKVGHCQALNLMKTKPPPVKAGGGFFRQESERPMNSSIRRTQGQLYATPATDWAAAPVTNTVFPPSPKP
jgi:hypothetical protein